MTAGILLRDDFDGSALRRLARQSHNAGQTRRLLALAEIHGGGSRSDAARIGGVGVQIVRDWVVRFNAKGPDGLLNGKAPGHENKRPVLFLGPKKLPRQLNILRIPAYDQESFGVRLASLKLLQAR
jgi:Winged helix-turn helix